MAKTALDPSKFFLGNATFQKNFLDNSKTWFEEILGIQSFSLALGNYTTYYKRVRFLELLHQQYERGVRNGWLNVGYAEYEAHVLGKETEAPRRTYNPRWRKKQHGPYRRGNKYVRNLDHAPKEKNSPKQVWREFNHFDKDKSKRHWFSGSRGRSFFKNYQNRQRRRMERDCILKDMHEEIVEIRSDRWLWD